jgi:hypothetical protein
VGVGEGVCGGGQGLGRGWAAALRQQGEARGQSGRLSAQQEAAVCKSRPERARRRPTSPGPGPAASHWACPQRPPARALTPAQVRRRRRQRRAPRSASLPALHCPPTPSLPPPPQVEGQWADSALQVAGPGLTSTLRQVVALTQPSERWARYHEVHLRRLRKAIQVGERGWGWGWWGGRWEVDGLVS